MLKSVVSVLSFTAFAAAPFSAVAADAYDAYSSCDCVTALMAGSANAGVVSSSQGQVLVNGVLASDGAELSIGSEVLTGAGSASMSVGATCQQAVGPNTQVLISQPGGPGANLCVQIASNPGAIAPAATVAGAGTGSVVGGALLIAGGVAGIIALTDDDDDDRGSASP